MKKIFQCFIALFTFVNWSLLAQPVVVWQASFDSNSQPENNWDGSFMWQFGRPTHGPGATFSGDGVAAANLSAPYANNANARLSNISWINVPSASQNPYLEGYSYTNFADASSQADFGKIQILVRDSGTWTDVYPVFYSSSCGVYSRFEIDLKPYAGKQIRIGFLIVSDGSVTAAGWFIDELKVIANPNPSSGFPANFANGMERWHSSGTSGFTSGRPTTGITPPSADGNCVGTSLVGNYSNNMSARLVSPAFIVPEASREPRLRFRHFLRLADASSRADRCVVQVLLANGSWVTISSEYSGSSGGAWANGLLDLSDYAGQTIRIGFWIVSDGSVNDLGWYIDDIDLLVNNTCATVTTSFSKQNVSCNGGSNGSANVTIAGATNATYQWSNGATSAAVSNLAAGKYYVTVSGASVCTKIDSVQITEPTKVSATYIANNPNCGNLQSGSITLSPNGGAGSYTYRWNDGNTSNSRSNLAGGNYPFTVTDANNCAFLQSVTLLVPPSVSARISGDSVLQTGGSVTLTATGGGTYRWNTGATTASIAITSAGTYSVTVSNSNGSVTCSAIASQTVRLAPTNNTFNVSCRPDTFCYAVRLPSAFTGVNGGSFINISFNSSAVRPTGYVRLGKIIPINSTVFLTNTNGMATATINFSSATGISGVTGDTLICIYFQLLPNFIRPDTTTNFMTDVRFEWLNGQVQNVQINNTIKILGVSIRKDVVYISNEKLFTSNTATFLNYLATCGGVSTSEPLTNGAATTTPNSNHRIITFSKKIERISGPLIHSGQDAYLAYQIYISNIAATSYVPTIFALIAADVNGDGQVSLSDITLILRRSVGDIEAFPQFGSTALLHTRFFKVESLSTESFRVSPTYPSSNGNTAYRSNIPKIDSCQTIPILPDYLCDTIQQRWITVILGDVDASILQTGVQLRSSTTVNISLCKASLTNSGDWLVPVSADQKTTGIDLKILNLSSNVEWLGIIDTDSIMVTAWNASMRPMVAITGFSPLNNGTAANRALFYLRLRLKNDTILRPSFFGMVEAYHNGQTANVAICPATSTVDKTPPSVFRLFPTPATDEIWIEQTPTNSQYLFIFNALGQIIERISPNATGLMQVDISRFPVGSYWIRSDALGKALPFIKL